MKRNFVEIGLSVGLGAKIAAFAPIGPCPGKAVEHLLGRGFANHTLFNRQLGQRIFVGDRAPEEFRHIAFAHTFQNSWNPGAAEIFLRQHVQSDLAPAFRHFDGVVLEHDLAIGITGISEVVLPNAIAPYAPCVSLKLNFRSIFICPVPCFATGFFSNPVGCPRFVTPQTNRPRSPKPVLVRAISPLAVRWSCHSLRPDHPHSLVVSDQHWNKL